MPGYAGTGEARLLLQNQQIPLFQQESVAAGTASIAVQLKRSRYTGVAIPSASGVSLQVYFTDTNGNPANPGAFEIDIQTSDIDADSQYCTASQFTSGLNTNYVGHAEFGPFYARYMRVFVKTLTNAVFSTIYLTGR